MRPRPDRPNTTRRKRSFLGRGGLFVRNSVPELRPVLGVGIIGTEFRDGTQKRAENPPSVWRSWPLIHRPSSDSRNAVTPAMSFGVPVRPSGWYAVIVVRVSSSIHPVSIGPGLTTLADISRGPSSRAAEMTIRSSAPLDAP